MTAPTPTETNGRSRAHTRRNGGFTLAEMLVATVLLSIVMGSVYSLFSTTIHGWRLAEDDFQNFQEARLAFAKFENEAENLFAQADYLFEGDGRQVTMFVIAEPMDLDAGGGRRIMQVRYRFNQGKHELIREERLAKASLPARPPQGAEIDRGRIELKTPKSFTLAEGLSDLEFRYVWVPKVDREKGTPPQWIAPLTTDRHAEGWGLPHAIEVTMVVTNPKNEDETKTFRARVPVRTNRNEKTVQELSYMIEGR